jgi:Ferritin-like domain
VEKKLNDLIDKALSRRKFMAGAGTAAAATLIVGCNNSSPAPTSTPTPTPTPTPTAGPVNDADILTFALNLEYLEAEYYLYATTGSGLSATDAGPGAGSTLVPSTGTMVTFADKYLQQYANEIAQDELNHVRFLRSALSAAGVTPQSRPFINLTFFAGLGTAAGISGTFNPFTDEDSFLTGAFVFEDVGVTAYLGAAPLISNKAYLAPAAGILGTEAYHAAEIRTIIAGNAASSSATASQTAALTNANLISALRGQISMASGNMLAAETTLSTTSVVAADSTNAIAFARTTDQVLHIVYGGTAGAGVSKGGFFPDGLNGKINTTTT